MARKPYTVALLAFICFYVITESRSGSYIGNGYGGTSGGKGYFYDPLDRQDKRVDDLDFYDVNLRKYGKSVNVLTSLVEVSFFMIISAMLLKKLLDLHDTTEPAAAEAEGGAK